MKGRSTKVPWSVLHALPVGLTYRMLDYWVRQGYIRAPFEGGSKGGSGVWRDWPGSELRVAETMARLRAAGLDLEVAAKVARGCSQIAPGVYVLLDLQ
jgi:hypothetical protein